MRTLILLLLSGGFAHADDCAELYRAAFDAERAVIQTYDDGAGKRAQFDSHAAAGMAWYEFRRKCFDPVVFGKTLRQLDHIHRDRVHNLVEELGIEGWTKEPAPEYARDWREVMPKHTQLLGIVSTKVGTFYD